MSTSAKRLLEHNLPVDDMRIDVRCSLAQLLDRGDNALQLVGDGFGDRLERRIANMLHRYCRVDGSDFDLAASEILHDDVARQHCFDLVISSQRLMRQRWVTRAEYPIIPKIEIELFLHRCFDVDFGQNAKALCFEGLDDPFQRGWKASAHDFGYVIFHLNTSIEPNGRRNFRATMRCQGLRRRKATTAIPRTASASISTPIPPKPPIP